MTVENQVNKVTGLGNDVATSFSFSPMVINAASELLVTHVDANDLETVLSEGTGTTDYAVVVSAYPGTGSITYPATLGTELPTGESLVIKRVLVIEQQTDLENQGGYFPEVQETAFDKLTMMVLQQQEILDRAFKVAVSVATSFDVELPSNIESLPGYQVVVNDAGTGLELGAVTSATVSPIWATVLDDTTLAASLVSLGFSSVVQAILQDTTAADIAVELDVLQNGLLTTRGDIIYRNATIPARLAVGAANTLLVSDGTDPIYRTLAAEMDTLLTTRGDIAKVGATTTERLALGAKNTVLQSDGTDILWSDDASIVYNPIHGMHITLDTVGGDTEHDINIKVGKCWSQDGQDEIVLATEITKQIDAAWSVGDDAGGMDTGSVAADTGYYVWIIKRSDTGVVDALFSLSLLSPTMPTNYDIKRRIGFIASNSTSNIVDFSTINNVMQYETGTTTEVLDVNDSTITNQTFETATIRAPAFGLAKVIIYIQNTTGTNGYTAALIKPTSEYRAASVNAHQTIFHAFDTGIAVYPEQHTMETYVWLDGNSQCKYSAFEPSGAATVTVYTLGYIWPYRDYITMG
jgi:hypothetical protein